MKNRLRALALRFQLTALMIPVVLTGCSSPSETDTQKSTQEVARTITVARVELKPIINPLVVSGLLVSWEEAAVNSEVTGFRVSKVLFEEGAKVKKDQILAILAPELLEAKIAQAEASLEQANAQAAQAKSEAARVSDFDGKGVLSDESIEIRRTQAQAAIANVKVTTARLSELRIQEQRLFIRAPVGGTILERKVREGDIANTNTLMFRIARDSRIEVAAEIPEQHLSKISIGQNATVLLPSNIEITGTTRLISPRINPASKLGQVRISLPLHPELRIGGYALVTFENKAKPVPAVPEKAIQFEASGPSVIVIDNNNRAHFQSIKTTTRANGYVAFEQGPSVGSKIALGGGAFVLEGDLVNPIEPAPPTSDTISSKQGSGTL